MSSLTNINNNSSVINVGRTTPVSPGQQPAAGSIPVVVAYDQAAIPVIEQQKIQSEVALSLLGIPRSEVALGIFADVNTYDVNPAEWSSEPAEYVTGHGIKHLPEEAGALVEAPKDKIAVLTSKRFFRYQPGRVSAATFGIKSTKSPRPTEEFPMNLNPAIKKFGIFDKYDGYYWETVADGEGDNFRVVRRTQSLLKHIPVKFGPSTQVNTQQVDHGIAGKGVDAGSTYNQLPNATRALIDNRFNLAESAFAAAGVTTGSSTGDAKCIRDMDLVIDAYIADLQWGGNAHTVTNATTYTTAAIPLPSVEQSVHTALRNTIVSFLTALGENTAASKISILAGYTLYATGAVGGQTFTNAQLQGTAVLPGGAMISFGQRNKIETIFSIYKNYIGYLIAYDPGYTYDSSPIYSQDELKYRCMRDVGYIIDGYARDLIYGGNSATVFNAKSYYFAGLQVYSQLDGTTPAEVAKHNKIKQLLTSTNNVTVGTQAGAEVIPSVITRFGLSTYSVKLNQLCDIIIGNFTTPYAGLAEYGNSSQFGDLVVLRDNLLMIHAAVYDPSLLKQTTQVVVRVNPVNNTLEAAEGEFVPEQHIRFVGNALTNNKIYKIKKIGGVSGARSNVLKLVDPQTNIDIDITTIGTGVQYIEPNVPFIFPEDYYTQSDVASVFTKPDGVFPYLYTDDGDLTNLTASTVGFINTALNPDTNAIELRNQIDLLNLKYNNWVKQNVDPKYYSVYEYRVPRSRFSTDQLNGTENNSTVYSDIATDANGQRAYAGQPVLKDGVQSSNDSVWNLDFTKVSMLKIEFSWYGAVGALFLAYVPVGNGEARWVRVHHLRASNQLKISSLGNATLPITYLVFGGGSTASLGIPDSTDKSYGSTSEHVVKYGASYYIDGGDRGTVRLYSHSNDLAVPVYGNSFNIGGVSLIEDTTLGAYYIDLASTPGVPSDLSFFMGAKVTTGSRQDQNIEVVWTNGTRIYLNRSSLVSSSSVKLLANRPSIVFGLKAKENILNLSGSGVRNRVQVYPTRMSTANLSDSTVKLKVLKTPYFQPDVTTTGTLTLSLPYDITSANLPLPVSIGSTSYLTDDGEFVYGWFRANVGTVFGKVTLQGGSYYFTLLETFSVPVTLTQGIVFLKEGRFESTGATITGESEAFATKERLSSVFISTQTQCPIPKTGTEVSSFFLKPGSDQFDLLTYFDYNKDYLSYPLTNQIESLYLSCSSGSTIGTDPISDINASLTWEEQ